MPSVFLQFLLTVQGYFSLRIYEKYEDKSKHVKFRIP